MAVSRLTVVLICTCNTLVGIRHIRTTFPALCALQCNHVSRAAKLGKIRRSMSTTAISNFLSEVTAYGPILCVLLRSLLRQASVGRLTDILALPIDGR